MTKGYEEKNLDEKVFRIYENIYNQELNYKNSIDSKFTSRFTILIPLITAVSIVFYALFLVDKREEKNDIDVVILLYILLFFIVLSMIFFYKSFFRYKKNYRVMPTVEIRMFHFYIHRNNLLNTPDETDLYNYLIDSYQYCSFTNSKVNSTRESSIIILDHITIIMFLLSILEYVTMSYNGYSIKWFF